MNEIIENFTWTGFVNGIFSSIVAALIIKIARYLFKKTTQLKGPNQRYYIEQVGEIVGFWIAVLALWLFTFAYTFNVGLISENFRDTFLSIDLLVIYFTIGIGSFLFFHIFYGIRQIYKKQIHIVKFLEGLSAFILVSSIIVFFILNLKIVVELGQGMRTPEMEVINYALIPYGIILIKILFMSGIAMLISRSINVIVLENKSFKSNERAIGS